MTDAAQPHPATAPVAHRASSGSPPASLRGRGRVAPPILAIGENCVGVLHQLQPLEAVFVVQAHARADDFVQIENLERKVALVGAELAVVGVVERDQGVDASLLGGLELGLLQRAAMGRQRL